MPLYVQRRHFDLDSLSLRPIFACDVHVLRKSNGIEQTRKNMSDPEKQAFLVQAEDGRKFKMVIRGDLSKIPVEKIKRYLKAYGVPDGQTLMHEGRILTDDMYGADFGLTTNSVLKLASGDMSRGLEEPHRHLEVDVEGRQRQLAHEEEQRLTSSAVASSRQLGGAHTNSYTSYSSAHSVAGLQEWPRRNAPDAPAALSSPGPSYSAPFGTPYQTYRGAAAQHQTSSGGVTELRAATSGSSEHPLQQQVTHLESDNHKLRREVESLKLELESKRSSVGPAESLLASAKANLHELGKELGIHLVLDQNLSCVVGNDEAHTIIITFDAPTERLYVYSTLLSFIPQDDQLRLKLFEVLLDGALLGRDVAGGGIGASMQSGVVMMSTSILLRHSGPGALRDVVPAFVEALVRWRAIISETIGLH